MPAFEYQAITRQNKDIRGVLVAQDRPSAMRELADAQLIVLTLRENGGHVRQSRRTVDRIAWRKPRIGTRQIALLLIQWGRLLKAGLMIDDVLSLSTGQERKDSTASAMRALRDAIRGGASLHAALREQMPALPAGSLALIQASEAAGTLPEGLTRAGEDLLRAEQFRAELRTAFIYPAFVLVTAAVVLAILLGVVIPTLEGLLEDFKQEPSGPAAVAITLSRLARVHGDVLILAGAGLAAGLVALTSSDSGRRAIDQTMLHLPLVRSLTQSANAYRMAHSLAVLLNGGLRLSNAIPIAAQAVTNRIMREAALAAGQRVSEGMALGAALEAAHRFPSDMVGLIKTGERSGKLALMLSQAAALHEERVRQHLKTIVAMLTPTLTVILGLVTGLIVLSVVTTILDLNAIALQ